MKNILLLFLLCLSFYGFSQNLPTLDEKNGFREMKFGDSVSKFKDLVILEYDNDSSSRFYSRTHDKLTIGSAEVTLVYGFYMGQMSSVHIKTKGYVNSAELLRVLIELYGKGYQSNEYIEHYVWYGQKVNMSYKKNSIIDDSSILMWSKIIQDQKDKDQKEKVEKAKGDF